MSHITVFIVQWNPINTVTNGSETFGQNNQVTCTEIPTLPIWSLASRSPDFYQILPIYYKILKTRKKLLIFRIFGDLSLWNTHIILTFFAKSIMVCYNSGRNDVKIQEMELERT